MLLSLAIHNIALIENLSLDFHQGMNVLSGETGAGKSIIVDSINLVLGERADRDLIRSGCEKASVEAQFDLSRCPQALDVLKEMQIEPEGTAISIYREMTVTGRNTCRLCGVIVPLAQLRQLTELLVDVHGQHEHQSLLDAKNHIRFLDSFGDDAFQTAKAETEAAYHSWKESSQRYAALRKENARRAEREEYLKSRVKELDAAALQTGESEALSAERTRFASAEKISTAIRLGYDEVQGNGKDGSAQSRLKTALDAVRSIEHLDPRYHALADRISSVYYELEEAGLELRSLLEEDTFDPLRFDEVQARLDQIRKLEKRYGLSCDELVRSHEEMKEELSGLKGMEEKLKTAETDYRAKLHFYRGKAALLTEKRRELASSLEKRMEAQLSELGMERTRFSVVFEKPEDEKRVVPTASGDDLVSFYIAPNPGEPLKPLDKTASGGELSRLMLAFKAAAADRCSVPTMIFDEIDTGISGNVANIVAEKMAMIAKYRQVLCVTHLAPIAAIADAEYLVRKEVIGERTFTGVKKLAGEDRVTEIARLIGVTDNIRESGLVHAREVLTSAQDRRKAL